jgi:D-sedoheptulose 7-phosphate isomerase
MAIYQNNDLVKHYQKCGEIFIDDTVKGLRTLSAVDLARSVEALHWAWRRRNRVYVFGNGGSASTASHMVCDLVKTAQHQNEPALRAFALTDGTAVLTAYANDVDYDEVFAAQLADNAEPGDVAVAISASGSSANVLAALKTARGMGLYSVGLLGCGGGPAAEMVDLALCVDSSDFGVIETAHLAIVHAWVASLKAVEHDTALAGGVRIPGKNR